MIFHNYQTSPIDNNECSPNLEEIERYHLQRWGGQDLGCFAKRAVRLGTLPSSHWSGAAKDIRYTDPGPGRTVCLNEIIPFYVDNHLALGIQAIHDYAGWRIWRVNRPSGVNGWLAQKTMVGGGGHWLHLEVHPEYFWDGRPVDERLLGTVDPGAWPPFNPAAGQFSLYPLATDKPILRVGSAGDPVKYLQGVLRVKLGWNLTVDGQFGNITAQHVAALQHANGLVADSIVGPRTWEVVDWAALNM